MEAALAEVLGAERVSGLTRLSGGASRETFLFEADGERFVLQRQRAGDVRDMGNEAAVLRAAFAAGVPVAELVASSNVASEIGSAFMVSRAVDGETIARKILRDPEFAEARRVLAGQLGAALAKVHATDVAHLTTLPVVEVHDQLPQYRALLDGYADPHPAFELAFRWLHDHQPPPTRRTLVHGDFRLGNVMVGSDGLRAALDWELAHLGDPMEDLGWLCVKAWRFGSPYPVAGVGDYAELAEAYEAASGIAVDIDVVRWWEVLGTMKWGIMCMGQANTHLSGVARSHELAAIGRRVCENEHDLFLALEGRW